MTGNPEFEEARHLLATANRVLDNEKVLDAFGHVSMRHPERGDRFLLSSAKAPALVLPGDILEFDLDSAPVETTDRPLYSERVMHGSIYRNRPDVRAVVHHHASAVMPFCITDVPLEPVNQLGGTLGETVPVWDSAEAIGDTNLLITRAEEADSATAALGPHWTLLLKRHGAIVVGRSLKEMVFRAIHGCDNAHSLWMARLGGTVTPLTPGERRLTGELRESPIDRCWDYWLARLERAGQAVQSSSGPVQKAGET